MTRLSAEKFLELLRRSKLLEEERIAAILDEARQQDPTLLDDAERLGARLVESGVLTRWQCDKLLEGRYKPFFLGKYRLLGHLGTGGMSSVYLADHSAMQRRVAIKVLPPKRVEDSSYLERFYVEAQAAAALDHRNIVRAYDIDHEGAIHYLIMEYVEGRDLQTIVQQDGPLDYDTAANYMRQAAEGLDHAHAAGLIHRDVKPANLLVNTKGIVKILDMGLARFDDDSRASLTLAYDENVLGTADYLAPEQAVNSHAVDGRADIYSLGCTFYYLLTGRPPFSEGTLAQRILKHQTQAPPSIFIDRPNAPKDLVQIYLKMIQKNPNKRFQSASEIAESLSAWLSRRRKSSDAGKPSESSAALAAAIRAEREEQGLGLRSSPYSREPAPGGGSALGRENAPSPEDTVSDMDRATMKGPASSRPRPSAGDSNLKGWATLAGDSQVKASPSAKHQASPKAPRGPAAPPENLDEIITDFWPVPKGQQVPYLPAAVEEHLQAQRGGGSVPVWVWISLAAGVPGIGLVVWLLLSALG